MSSVSRAPFPCGDSQTRSRNRSRSRGRAGSSKKGTKDARHSSASPTRPSSSENSGRSGNKTSQKQITDGNRKDKNHSSAAKPGPEKSRSLTKYTASFRAKATNAGYTPEVYAHLLRESRVLLIEFWLRLVVTFFIGMTVCFGGILSSWHWQMIEGASKLQLRALFFASILWHAQHGFFKSEPKQEIKKSKFTKTISRIRTAHYWWKKLRKWNLSIAHLITMWDITRCVFKYTKQTFSCGKMIVKVAWFILLSAIALYGAVVNGLAAPLLYLCGADNVKLSLEAISGNNQFVYCLFGLYPAVAFTEPLQFSPGFRTFCGGWSPRWVDFVVTLALYDGVHRVLDPCVRFVVGLFDKGTSGNTGK